MERRIQLWCAWCGPLALGLMLVGMLVAGLIPPQSAGDSAQQIASWYRDNADQLRAGTLILLIAAPLLIPFMILLTLELRRSNRRLAPLAYVQLVCGVILMLELFLPTILIGVAAFRPERPPADTQLLNDVAFTILLWAFSAPTLEYLAIGLAILLNDSPDPLFPRWTGWVDIAVAAIFATGGPALFIKHGAFSWDGALAFWAVLGSFGAWVWVTFFSLRASIQRTEPNSTSTMHSGA